MIATLPIHIHPLRYYRLCFQLIELTQELADGGNAFRIELVYSAWIDRHTHSARCGVHAKRRFEQMVPMLRHFAVDTRVGVLEHNVLHCSVQRLFYVRDGRQ